MKLQEICDYYGDLFIQAIFDEAKKVAKENPNFVYSTHSLNTKCFYNKGPTGGPVCDGCIIGQALQTLGWDDTIEMQYLGPVDMLISAYTDHKFSEKDKVLLVIQGKQDNGLRWGECV